MENDKSDCISINDIESLGWVMSPDHIFADCIEFFLLNYELVRWVDNDKNIKIVKTSKDNDISIFRGKIKNKFQLKYLMKMLCIPNQQYLNKLY